MKWGNLLLDCGKNQGWPKDHPCSRKTRPHRTAYYVYGVTRNIPQIPPSNIIETCVLYR